MFIQPHPYKFNNQVNDRPQDHKVNQDLCGFAHTSAGGCPFCFGLFRFQRLKIWSRIFEGCFLRPSIGSILCPDRMEGTQDSHGYSQKAEQPRTDVSSYREYACRQSFCHFYASCLFSLSAIQKMIKPMTNRIARTATPAWGVPVAWAMTPTSVAPIKEAPLPKIS